MPHSTVIIRPSVLTFLLSLLLLGAGALAIFPALVTIVLVPLSLVNGTFDISSTFRFSDAMILLFSLVMGPTLLWFAITLLFQKYRVDVKGIEINRLRKNMYIKWSQVSQLNYASSKNLRGYQIHLTYLEKNRIVLLLPFLAEPHFSAKAVIEAAYLGNQNVELNLKNGYPYRQPPYFIFTPKPIDEPYVNNLPTAMKTEFYRQVSGK